jgi:hypothetical protein
MRLVGPFDRSFGVLDKTPATAGTHRYDSVNGVRAGTLDAVKAVSLCRIVNPTGGGSSAASIALGARQRSVRRRDRDGVRPSAAASQREFIPTPMIREPAATLRSEALPPGTAAARCHPVSRHLQPDDGRLGESQSAAIASSSMSRSGTASRATPSKVLAKRAVPRRSVTIAKSSRNASTSVV